MNDYSNLNHSFEETYAGDDYLKCKVCNLKVFIGEEILYIYSWDFGTWKTLDISCEEILIKRLLE